MRFIRGCTTFLRTGRLWYQKVLVGLFMRSRLPCASSSFTDSICLWTDFPRASLCRKIKSRAAPRETEAIGQRGSSSFSSSRCSPIWSWPSLYLPEWREPKRNTCSPNLPVQLKYSRLWSFTYLLIKTKLNVWPVVFVTASRIYSSVGVHGEADRVTPE